MATDGKRSLEHDAPSAKRQRYRSWKHTFRITSSCYENELMRIDGLTGACFYIIYFVVHVSLDPVRFPAFFRAVFCFLCLFVFKGLFYPYPRPSAPPPERLLPPFIWIAVGLLTGRCVGGRG
jgi:hypothetical protein